MSEAGLESEPKIKFVPTRMFQPRRNTRIRAFSTKEEKRRENKGK